MHHPSISRHIIPLKFPNWNITIYSLDKKPYQRIVFQTFECPNEGSPNFLCLFWKHKVRFYSNSPSLFSVMKDDSCIFLVQTSYSLEKNSPPKWNFRNFEWLGRLKFTRFLIFEIPSQLFLNFASLFNVMRDNSSVLF